MERVRAVQLTTPDEIANEINRIIDRNNENDNYNELVEKYNDEPVKKGD